MWDGFFDQQELRHIPCYSSLKNWFITVFLSLVKAVSLLSSCKLSRFYCRILRKSLRVAAFRTFTGKVAGHRYNLITYFRNLKKIFRTLRYLGDR